MHWPQTGATQYHAQLGLPDESRAIKGFVACNNWKIKPKQLFSIFFQNNWVSTPNRQSIIIQFCIKHGKLKFYLALSYSLVCHHCSRLLFMLCYHFSRLFHNCKEIKSPQSNFEGLFIKALKANR